jgi:hypothetical protein
VRLGVVKRIRLEGGGQNVSLHIGQNRFIALGSYIVPDHIFFGHPSFTSERLSPAPYINSYISLTRRGEFLD